MSQNVNFLSTSSQWLVIRSDFGTFWLKKFTDKKLQFNLLTSQCQKVSVLLGNNIVRNMAKPLNKAVQIMVDVFDHSKYSVYWFNVIIVPRYIDLIPSLYLGTFNWYNNCAFKPYLWGHWLKTITVGTLVWYHHCS